MGRPREASARLRRSRTVARAPCRRSCPSSRKTPLELLGVEERTAAIDRRVERRDEARTGPPAAPPDARTPMRNATTFAKSMSSTRCHPRVQGFVVTRQPVREEPRAPGSSALTTILRPTLRCRSDVRARPTASGPSLLLLVQVREREAAPPESSPRRSRTSASIHRSPRRRCRGGPTRRARAWPESPPLRRHRRRSRAGACRRP